MRLIIKLIILLFSIVLIDQLIGFQLTNLYEKNYCKHSGGSLNYYLKHKRHETIFVGSSRVKNSIIPSKIGKDVSSVTNMGMHFLYHLSVVHLMEQYDKLPKKTLVFNLEAEDFYVESEQRLINDVFYLKYYYDKNEFVKNIINSKSVFEKYKFLSASYKFNGENFLLFTNKFQCVCNTRRREFMPLLASQNDSLNIEKHKHENTHFEFTRLNKKMRDRLGDLNAICKRNNLQLILLYGPHFFEVKEYKEASDFIQKYCQKNHIRYLNINNKNIPEFKNNKLWKDNLHLNEEGAKFYTKILKDSLIQFSRIQ